MQVNTGITTHVLSRNFHKSCRDILTQLQPRIEKAVTDVKLTGKAQHHVLVWYHNDKPYLCSIYYSRTFSQNLVYELMPGEKYFEAVTYDAATNRYHYFDAHFFERYAQRMSLRHKQPVDILKHYLVHNPVMVFDQYVDKRGTFQKITALVNTGIIYAMLDPKNRMMHFRTLIDHYSLCEKKRVRTGHLRKALRKLAAG